MAVKRPRSAKNPSKNSKISISDLWTSHLILAPNEYSSAAIGIHGCLVRCLDSEHLGRGFYQALTFNVEAKNFLRRMDEMERKLRGDCQLDIQRVAMIARLRCYLQNNGRASEQILKQIKEHLDESMREYQLPQILQTYDVLERYCSEKDRAAVQREILSRRQRLQFYDQNEVERPMNLINLQNRTRADLNLLIFSMKSNLANRDQCETGLRNLLNNSFFIVQPPSPAVVTLSSPKNHTVTAKLNCRVLSLFDVSNSEIIIESIVPTVCLLKSDQVEGRDLLYEQAPLNWTTYSIVTTNNNRKEFSCANLSEIQLTEMPIITGEQLVLKGKIRHAPFVYHIIFYITVKIPSLDNEEPFEHVVAVLSSPFGLVTNTSQSELLLAEVFLEDLKSWKSIVESSPTSISHMNASATATVNLTVADIVESIRRYFIQKIGIRPKPLTMSYINRELNYVYSEAQNFRSDSFRNTLAKFLSQIDYMAKNALLSFFYDDELFLGICDSEQIDAILLWKKENTTENVCALRFGSITRMACAKDIGVRISLAHASYTTVQKYTFVADKISSELGSFIVKIAESDASHFDRIISNITEDTPQKVQVLSVRLKKFVDLYYGGKLRELCPQDSRYKSIWLSFDTKENEILEDSRSDAASSRSQNASVNNPTGIDQNDLSQLYATQLTIHSQASTTSQMQMPSVNNLNMVQVTNPSSLINPAPVIIIISSTEPWIMTDQNVADLISTSLPQYSPFVQSDRIHRFFVNPPPAPHSIDTSPQLSNSSLSNFHSIHSTFEDSEFDETNVPNQMNQQ